LIVKISECEGELLPLGHSCYTKIEPGLVVVNIFYMRFAVLGDPQVELILFTSSTSPW